MLRSVHFFSHHPTILQLCKLTSLTLDTATKKNRKKKCHSIPPSLQPKSSPLQRDGPFGCSGSIAKLFEYGTGTAIPDRPQPSFFAKGRPYWTIQMNGKTIGLQDLYCHTRMPSWEGAKPPIRSRLYAKYSHQTILYAPSLSLWMIQANYHTVQSSLR